MNKHSSSHCGADSQDRCVCMWSSLWLFLPAASALPNVGCYHLIIVAPWDGTSMDCGCYEALESIISTDHQACCVEGATDCHWWTHLDSCGCQECFWPCENNNTGAPCVIPIADYRHRFRALVMEHIIRLLLLPPYPSRLSSGLWPSDSVVSIVPHKCWHVKFLNINTPSWHTWSKKMLNIRLSHAEVYSNE